MARRRRAEVRTAPASFAQQRLWFLDQLHPGRAAYNVYSAFRFTGPLSHDTLAASLNAIVARHESLRTTFPEHDVRDGCVMDHEMAHVTARRRMRDGTATPCANRSRRR